MVPVLASNDENRSRAVLTLLEAHGIPGMLDTDLNGAFVGFHDPVPPGWYQVLVPTSMRAAALRILREHEGDGERRGAPGAAPHVIAALPSWWRPEGESGPADDISTSNEELLEDEDYSQTVDAELLRPTDERIRLALLAVVFGIVVQELLVMWFGDRQVILTLGAKSPIGTELYRLVTAGFLHGGAAHMVSNAALGLVFGVALFGTHGLGATALVWLLASIAGMGAEVLLSPDSIVIGSSAGNYGLVGLWASGQWQRSSATQLPKRERLKTLGILLLLLPGALAPFSYTGTRIAVFAHIVGFLGGVLAGLWFQRRLHTHDIQHIEVQSRKAGWVAVAVGSLGWSLGIVRLLAL
ncbi:MAG: rhomboid family intramembrane serine protease [Myxococcales bacterium]|nr:rhomboid family intramembrane serine protease [Myxococcales bacterium]